ncbi:MAG: hypothetical protein IJR02_13375 [Bacteroidaceae bacterium]|nr:hypothetical protein [Bacteroidaceae bacterium]
MRQNLLKTMVALVAMMICLGASAMDKVVKKAEMTGEITSVEDLKSARFMLQNDAGLLLYTPDGWDIKVGTLLTAISNKGNGGFYELTELDDHFLIPIYNIDGSRRTFWAGEQYVNSQPAGGNVIFGLDGVNAQHGQDGPNLAVWDITYEEGKGFAFHCVGRDIYIGNDNAAARPVEAITYWKAYTGYLAGYDEDEVITAYAAAEAAVKTVEAKNALSTAFATYNEDANLDAFGDAVNAAIDMVNACEAVNAAYANLDAAGAAVAADVLAKYNDGEYNNIAELRAAYIAAAKAQTTPGAVMTGAIINPSFELGTIEGWTSNNGGNVANNYNFAQRTGEKFVERWTAAPGKLSDGSLSQVVTDLPNGMYKLTAEMHNMEQGNNSAPGQGYYLVANEDRTAVAANGETVVVKTNVTDGTLTIAATMDGCTGNWICVDNFQLTFLGETASEEDLAPLTEEIAIAQGLGVDVSAYEGQTYAAYEVEGAVNALKVAEYVQVNADYIQNVSSLVPDFATWEGGMVSNKGQHWDGTGSSVYYEQTGAQWGADSWTNSKTTTVNLPKGKYVLYAAGRASAGTDCKAYITVGEETRFYTSKGDVGFGVNTSGEACFDPAATYANGNKGRGFEYRYIAFEVTADEGEDVTLTIGGEATAAKQWMSFTAPILLTTADNSAIAKQVLAADIEAAKAVVAAQEGVGDGLFMIPEEAYNTYSNAVDAAEAVLNAEGATVEEVEQAIADLKAAGEAYAAAPRNEPKEGHAYFLALKTSDENSPFFLSISADGIKIIEDETQSFLVAQGDGKYAISNGTEYVNYAGGNNWTMAASTEAYGWTIAPAEGGYTITGKNGLLGTNSSDGNAAGSPCYGDKKTSNGNCIWSIVAVEDVPVVVYEELTADMFYEWTGPEADAEIVGVGGCEVRIGEEANAGAVIYGNGSVLEKQYADLSNFDALILTVESGTPRLLFNTVGASDPKQFIEIQAAGEYAIVEGNQWTIDLAKMKEDKEFVHLNVIKATWGGAATVSSIMLAKIAEPEIAEIYNGIVEQTLLAPSQEIVATSVSDQTVKIEKDENGLVANITFSGFETPLPGLATFPEFTIENVGIEEEEEGTKIFYSADNFQISIPRGQMTVNWNGKLEGEQAGIGETPVFKLTLVNGSTDVVYFGESQEAIDAYKAAHEIPEIAKYEWSFDFEDEDENVNIVGGGAIVDDENEAFGKVFENVGGAVRTNYLTLPDTVLAQSAASKELTIGFWVNAMGQALANPYAPFFTAYASNTNGADNTFPMLALQSRGLAQVNCTTWTDFTGEDNVEGKNNVYNQNAWEANDGAFNFVNNWIDDSDWHQYTAVFTEEGLTIYLDGEVKNQWTCNGTEGHTLAGLFSNGGDLKHICLGGNQAWNWGDGDAPYRFDDVFITNYALSAEDIAEIMEAKKQNLSGIYIVVNRTAGLGYSADAVEYDEEEILEALGIESWDAIETMYPLVITTGEPGTDYDGWRDVNGDPAEWNDDGTGLGLCLKYPHDGSFALCTHPGNDPEAGTELSAGWILSAGGKSVVVIVNVNFLEPTPIDLTFDDLNKVDNVSVGFSSETGAYYEGMTSDVDVAAILTKLGVESLKDVTIYAVQSDGSLDSNYKLGLTDGWRNADGDWQAWTGELETAPYFFVKADFSKADTQLYAVGGYPGHTDEAVTYTATYAFVKSGTADAVVLKVNLTYVAPLDPDLIEIAQEQNIDMDPSFPHAELVKGEDYNTYTANADLTIAFKMVNVDVQDCDYVVIKFAEPVAAGWHLAFWSGQDLVDVPEGTTEFKYVFADDPNCGVVDGVLPQICMMTFFGGFTAPLEAKVAGVYKHYVGVADGIAGFNAAQPKANGKYFEKRQIFIMKNGVKYNTAGQAIK